MEKLRIILISDLHVGKNARGIDLCPHPLEEDEKIVRPADYIAVFEAWAKSAPRERGRVADLLCVTGDISNTAHAHEFEFADRALSRMATAIGISESEIFFVPGNHDINWPVMKLEPTSFWFPQRYAPLLQEKLAFARRNGAAVHGALETTPYFVSWETERALIIAVNSAAYDGPTEKPHNGVIKQETVEEIDRYLAAKPANAEMLRICLLHHHLEQYSEPMPDHADFSIAVNAENLVKVLSKHRVDLVLHGHKHHPRLGTKQPDNSHPFVSICAGSFSSILPSPYYEGVPNLFHVINVDGREEQTGRIKGVVESWAYIGGQWIAGKSVNGMYAVDAFGSAATPTEIAINIKASLERRMAVGPICRWLEILEDHPYLAQVRTDVAYTQFKQVSSGLGLDMAGDPNVPEKNWIAFRRS
jgi:3',5'-cyclic AMP phosphodiesterase CpdA